MIVMKFGGTSVGSAPRMQHVAQLIGSQSDRVFVVLSAMSGTTNALLQLCDSLSAKRYDEAKYRINELERLYLRHIDELLSTGRYRELCRRYLRDTISHLKGYNFGLFTTYEQRTIVSYGELLSTHMLYYYMQECGMEVTMLPALDFMRTDKDGEPDMAYIRSAVVPKVEGSDSKVFLTQGFICRNVYGEVDNLQRGGSDYTASLIGAVLSVAEIQIWTDIDGMHNNDPRVVDRTDAIHQLHFDEAAELAYFGAKILHPTCVLPAKEAGIPVRLLNTMDPTAEGTIINNTAVSGTIKAVAAKDGITAIKVKSSRMLLATGFLRKIFEIFEVYNTPIDMLATSEVGVSMSIDNTKHLDAIVTELEKYGTVTVDTGMCIVCVVGDLAWSNVGYETTVLQALWDIPIRMISYGGSNYNISFLIRECDKARALQNLSTTLFYSTE